MRTSGSARHRDKGDRRLQWSSPDLPPRRVAARAALLLAAAAALVGVVPAAAAIPDAPNPTWGTDGRVTAILPVGNTIYVGGTFANVVDRSGVTYPAANLAAFDATTGAAITTWAPSTNGSVLALATDGTNIYLGGTFSTVDTKGRANLAAVDPSTGALANWKAGTSAEVDSIVASGGAVYAAGNFKTVTDGTGASFTRSYMAKFSGSLPTFVSSWAPPTPDARVRALAISTNGARMFVGGDFTTLGRANTNKTAAVLTSTGALDAYASTANNNNGYATVYTLYTDGTRLFEAVGGGGGACTVVNATTGARVWSKHTNGNVHGVNVVAGTVYCGGHFSGTGSFDGQTRSKMAAFDLATGTDLAFAPTINSSLGVWVTAADATHEYAGGDFTKISKVAQNHYAQWTDAALLKVPDPPTGLGATGGPGVVHLSWQAPANNGGAAIQNYNVYRHDPSGTYGAALAAPTGTSFDDTTGTPGTTYSYVVTAVNSVGESLASNEATAAPTVAPPGAPTGLTATAGSTSVQLAWTAPTNTGGSPLTDYNIYRGTATGAETLLTNLGATSPTSFVDSTVTAKTTYFYDVTAVNAVNEGAASNEVSATPGQTAPSPPVLSGTAGDAVNHLTWTAPTDGGGSAIKNYAVIRDGMKLGTTDAATLNFDDTQVTNGTTYTYKVRVTNAIDTTTSNKVTLTPTAAPPGP